MRLDDLMRPVKPGGGDPSPTARRCLCSPPARWRHPTTAGQCSWNVVPFGSYVNDLAGSHRACDALERGRGGREVSPRQGLAPCCRWGSHPAVRGGARRRQIVRTKNFLGTGWMVQRGLLARLQGAGNTHGGGPRAVQGPLTPLKLGRTLPSAESFYPYVRNFWRRGAA